MKRILALFLLPVLLLGLSSCSISPAEYYGHAQLYLGSGDFATAALMFDQLGEYEDSASFALYCAALAALEEDDLALARANFALVHPFKSSGRYLSLIEARVCEQNGSLEDALRLYTALGSFEDSQLRAQALQKAIPERNLAHARALMGASRWEQALAVLETLNGYDESAEMILQCREALAQAAYDQADALYAGGRYEEALAAFESLGDVLDAQDRARSCRDAMYARLEADCAAASMATAADLIARCEEMEDHRQAPQLLAGLQRRFALNLALQKAVYQRPWVHFGQDSSGDAPLLWRAIAAEGSTVTLLCQSAPLFAATATDLSAVPSLMDHPAVITFDAPRLTLDLDRFSFTRGSGTAEDPYQ